MIDWERVADLREEVGEEDFHEVVELFLEEVEEVIVRLLAGSDQCQLEDAMHFLKGSALNLGFRQLGQLCQAGERRAASGQAASDDLRQLTESYARSKLAFLQRIDLDFRAA